jgi:hypothetical protein
MHLPCCDLRMRGGDTRRHWRPGCLMDRYWCGVGGRLPAVMLVSSGVRMERGHGR